MPARHNTDQTMMINCRFDKVMGKNDCLYLDGLYLGVHRRLIELNNQDGGTLSESNFKFPIRKMNNVEFEKGEESYNKQFGAIRSTIESKFAEIGNVFYRFHGSQNTRVDPQTYNLQLKFCCFLLNLSTMCQDMETDHFHHLFLEENFDFPSENAFDDRTVGDRTAYEEFKEMAIRQRQMTFVQLLLRQSNTKRNSEESIIFPPISREISEEGSVIERIDEIREDE